MEIGEIFNLPLQSNVMMDPECSVNGHRMCCIQNYTRHDAHMQPTKHCKRVRKYIQSPYEKRHYEKTLELLELYPKYEERRQAFLEFITGAKEVEETKTWLHRVEVRMASAGITITHPRLLLPPSPPFP